MQMPGQEGISSIKGRRVGGETTAGTSSRRFDRGRVCADDTCSTVLSVYNASDYCWQHEKPRPYFVRVPRRKRSDAA